MSTTGIAHEAGNPTVKVTDDMEFTYTDEVKAAMRDVGYKKLGKYLLNTAATNQSMRDLMMKTQGKAQMMDRGTGRMFDMMTEGEVIRNHAELLKFCRLMNNKHMDIMKRIQVLTNQNPNCPAALIPDGEAMEKYHEEVMLELGRDFKKVGGGPNNWHCSWGGSRWRDMKMEDGHLIRVSYYGPKSCMVRGASIVGQGLKGIKHCLTISHQGWGEAVHNAIIEMSNNGVEAKIKCPIRKNVSVDEE